MAALYVVSTPIGNLEDVTRRATSVLASVDRILAEDTRRTSILLRRYGIETPLLSAHADNEEARAEQLSEWLAAGEDVALVSDAGTPLLSDPGQRLVRRAIAEGREVIPIPGPSAVLAALVGSGLDAGRFTFLGFLPRSGGDRTRALEQVAASPYTSVIFEAPTRLARTLRDLDGACGADRQVAVARELTKLHEEFFRGTLAEASAYYEDGPVRGEVVLVVAGASDAERSGEPSEEAEAAARALARALLAEGKRTSAVARAIVRGVGLPRNRAYQIALGEAEAAE